MAEWSMAVGLKTHLIAQREAVVDVDSPIM
jgi:hypothetical protein